MELESWKARWEGGEQGQNGEGVAQAPCRQSRLQLPRASWTWTSLDSPIRPDSQTGSNTSIRLDLGGCNPGNRNWGCACANLRQDVRQMQTVQTICRMQLARNLPAMFCRLFRGASSDRQPLPRFSNIRDLGVK